MNTKLAICWVIITMSINVATAGIAKPLLYKISASLFDDELDVFLEDIRPMLKTGNESLDIPCMNPYQIEYLNISTINNNASINGNITDVKLDGNLTDVKIYGLPDYIINTAKFRFATMQVKLNLTWSNITLNSLYQINGEINKFVNKRPIPVYGKGGVKLEATNFTSSATMKMGLKSGKIFVREMITSYHLGDIDLSATGIYDSKGASELVNAIVSSQLPQLIENYQSAISNKINSHMIESMNQQFAELTFEDFLNIIG